MSTHTAWLLVVALVISAVAIVGCDDDDGDTADTAATAEAPGGTGPPGGPGADGPVSPVRGIDQPPRRQNRPPGPRPPRTDGFRSIDGSGNNLTDTDMGAASIQLARRVPPAYGDGISTLAGSGRASARAISNAVCAQSSSIENVHGASDYLWQWGQFLDHDIDLTDGADPAETVNIAVPTGDEYFDPFGTGTAVIGFNRSLWNPASGTSTANPRQQLNEITAWVDASNVYGSDAERAEALRTMDGTGKLKTSSGDLLPFNLDGLPNAGGSSPALFLAGDVRANEQSGLIAMHTLFVREHNRRAGEIAAAEPGLTGDEIYERTREYVSGLMQAITYYEYLPALLGPGAIRPYDGYDNDANGRIDNLFSTAVYRYGHSALSTTLLRIDADGNEISHGHLALRDAFFNPTRITAEGGIDPILRGLAAQRMQAIDTRVVDDVRNFLFGPPGSGGFDLASLNIQRGRDHGLPDYNTVRQAIGLPAVEDWSDITADTDLQAALASVYDSVDDVDLWIGTLAEDPMPGSHVGPLARRAIARQFERLRDGDRFWYRRALPGALADEIRNTRLSDVIRRNTGIGNELPDDVFHVPAE